MSAFYNERDPVAAQWLRNLMAAGLIAPGVVDERDIRDIRPVELSGYRQCHFFAGIGVWSLALRRAGWPDDRPVWTGSCPCQPFSAAGKREGVADERHLWPAFFHLIAQHGPDVVLGEQVASKDGLGWLDLVSADLEAAGYAFGSGDLCAAGFSGAHIRQRLYFVGVADADHARLERWHRVPERAGECAVGTRGMAGRMADANGEDCSGRRVCGPGESAATGFGVARERSSGLRQDRDAHAPMLGRDAADWLFCGDGKWRPVEPGTFPLADAAPGRVGRLRAYGNALDLGTATGFVEAVVEALALPAESLAA